VYARSPFQLLVQLTDFYETWLERYAIRGHHNILFLKSFTVSYNNNNNGRTYLFFILQFDVVN
jgi:hypothetical protein